MRLGDAEILLLFMLFVCALLYIAFPQVVDGVPYGWDTTVHFVSFERLAAERHLFGSLWPQFLGVLFPLLYPPGLYWSYLILRLFLPSTVAFQILRYAGVLLFVLFSYRLCRNCRNPEAYLLVFLPLAAYAFPGAGYTTIGFFSAQSGMIAATFGVLFSVVSVYLAYRRRYILLSLSLAATALFHIFPEYLVSLVTMFLITLYTRDWNILWSAIISCLLIAFWAVPAAIEFSELNAAPSSLYEVFNQYFLLYAPIIFAAVIGVSVCAKRQNDCLCKYFVLGGFAAVIVAVLLLSLHVGRPHRVVYLFLAYSALAGMLGYGNTRRSVRSRIAWTFCVMLSMLLVLHVAMVEGFSERARSQLFHALLNHVDSTVFPDCPVLVVYSGSTMPGNEFWAYLAYRGVPVANGLYVESATVSTAIQSLLVSLERTAMVWAPNVKPLDFVTDNVLDYYGICAVYYGPRYDVFHPSVSQVVLHDGTLLPRIPPCDVGAGVGCIHYVPDYREYSTNISFEKDCNLPLSHTYFVSDSRRNVAEIISYDFPVIDARKEGWAVIKRAYSPLYVNLSTGEHCKRVDPGFVACYLRKGHNQIGLDTLPFAAGATLSIIGFVLLFFLRRTPFEQSRSRS